MNNTFQKHKKDILRKRMQEEVINAQEERIDILVNIALPVSYTHLTLPTNREV